MSAIAMSSGTTEFPVNAAVNAREWFAAIVDLENVAIMDDGRVSLPEMRILLSAIGSRVTDMPVRVATGINVLRPYMGLLRVQRWASQSSRPNRMPLTRHSAKRRDTSSAAGSPTSLS